jgi:hypothetical protein
VADDDERYMVTSYGNTTPKTNTQVGDTTLAPSQANKAEIEEDPPTYRAAMSHHDAIQWQISCAEELDIFKHMKLYEVVDRPTDCKVIDSKWVFKLKRGPDGEIAKHKAHVAAKGYMQIEGLDYDEMFAPVVKFTMI